MIDKTKQTRLKRHLDASFAHFSMLVSRYIDNRYIDTYPMITDTNVVKVHAEHDAESVFTSYHDSGFDGCYG